MNQTPDPFDTAIAIFIISITLLLVAGVAAAFALKIYRQGKADGFKEGATAERLRWHEAEMRLERRMIEDAMKDRDDITQMEIDL